MYKKAITTTLASSLLVLSAYATSVTFNVNTNALYDGATLIEKSNASGYTAVGIFGDISAFDTSSAAAFSSALSSSGFTTDNLSAIPVPVPVPNVWSESVDSGANVSGCLSGGLLMHRILSVSSWTDGRTRFSLHSDSALKQMMVLVQHTHGTL